MNKKILSVSILAIFMLVAISYATAVNTTDVDNKESPLYGIRSKRAKGEKISNIIENIKIKFLGERIFFLPFQRLRDTYAFSLREQIASKPPTGMYCTSGLPTTCPDRCNN